MLTDMAPEFDKRLLFVGSADSQIKWGLAVAREFEKHGYRCSCLVNTAHSYLNSRQLSEIGLPDASCPVVHAGLSQSIRNGFLDRFDVVVVHTIGSELQALLLQYQQRMVLRKLTRRPVFITGYVGVVYEKHIEGMSWRIGYDIICVNSLRDLRLFSRFFKAVNHSDDSLVRCGFPIFSLTNSSEGRGNFRSGFPVHTPVRTVLFATQPTVPESKDERKALLRGLIQTAVVNPEVEILVKPRTRPGESQYHSEPFHYGELLEEILAESPCPENLKIVYGAMSEFLFKVDAIVSVSSTAIMEGLWYGKRVMLLSDFGIDERLGNGFFTGAGVFGSFADLKKMDFASPNRIWLEENGFSSEDQLDDVVKRAESLLALQRTSGILPIVRRPLGAFIEQSLLARKVKHRGFRKALGVFRFLGEWFRRIGPKFQ